MDLGTPSHTLNNLEKLTCSFLQLLLLNVESLINFESAHIKHSATQADENT